MKDNSKKKKIWFIVLISVFTAIWVSSLTFFAIAAFSESTTNAIETWYSETFTDKTLKLMNVSVWSTLISTTAIVITLLSQELKKKYLA